MRIVIVGNGVAGISVARELRARAGSLRGGPADALEISVLAREPYAYYSRIRLPEVIGDAELDAELIALYKPRWYAERGIDVSLSREVVAIDRIARRAILSTGEELPYDALVLALGSAPVRPALPGGCLPGVLALREYDDALRIRASTLAHREAAAVIGGGLLGLEAALHVRLLGAAEVTVVEVAPRLLPRQLDSGGAALLERLLAGMGLRAIMGARVAAFEGGERIEGLCLEGGRRVAAGTALLSMGVQPRAGIAKAAGLETARGIVVDPFLRTSDPSIYAVGDCAEFRGAVSGIIPAALEQAASCAAAILGDESLPYRGTLPSNTLKVAGIELYSSGIVECPEGEGIEELKFEPGEGRYERYLLKDGVLAGAIVIGSKRRARLVQPKMGSPMTRSELDALMAEL